ncbi:3-phosphoshikimate 1-carboxyvinyltransferase [Natronosporangium hydrolyticum]|uniref:3-phosphoshikimate 1-carboxyvinyltransferase n=2 Tax=Natronosporangium hydrolyticum TaxID=2811111 RepID=A0A895YGU3_9ACTN|nr:3-phosphoshikimate 1-carboxyvinyltransferase [Natronosporangium hydrolyticum]
MTARALVLAAISDGPSTIHGPLHARDTELMTSGLRALGCYVSTMDDEQWLVRPRPLTGPAHIDVGLAGTVMRFLPPVAGLATGDVTFDGDARARLRPLRPLIDALRTAGVEVAAGPHGGLPVTVQGRGSVEGGELTLDASASSQLVSGLLLAAPRYRQGVVVRHVGPALPSRPHLRMTVEMLRAAGAGVDDRKPDVWTVAPGRLPGRAWEIEPDLSGAAPFLAAALVTGGEVTVEGWPHTTTQPGDQLRDLLTRFGATCTLDQRGLTVRGSGEIRGIEADLSDVSELTPVIAAVCALADQPSRLWGVAHIRGHETDRIAALSRELLRLGGSVTEEPDGLTITPRPLHGADFETYDDHRLAHAAAVIGLAVPGVRLTDASCTAKTLPDFPQRWAAMVASSGAPGGAG